MKTNMGTSIMAALALGFCAALPAADSLGEKQLDYPTSSEGIELTIRPERLPVFPATLKQEGFTKGEVELVVEIDEFGELRDHIVSKATRQEFAKEVKRVIHSWDFDPPMWNGKSVPVITRIKVNFESTGDVISFNLASGMLNRFIGEENMMRMVTKNLVTVDELDSFPIPKNVSKPRVPKELLEQNKGTMSIFSFYIDQRGRVRMPALESVDGEVDLRLLVAVQDALMRWEFEPPTSRGRPVVVRVSQPFHFSG